MSNNDEIPSYVQEEPSFAKNTKQLTNTDFLIWLSEFSPAGALGQVFIMTALDAYAKLSLEHNTCPNDDMINPVAWKRAAQHISNCFDDRNERERHEVVPTKVK